MGNSEKGHLNELCNIKKWRFNYYLRIIAEILIIIFKFIIHSSHNHFTFKRFINTLLINGILWVFNEF